MNSPNQEENVIRLSLSWLAMGVVGVTALGIVGGALGQQLIKPPLPPLNNASERLITTVQEVTVSPSVLASKMVQDNERSVLAIARENAAGEITMVATGIVVTSDGLVVTPNKIGDQAIVGIDHKGTSLQLTLVGTDSIFGLSYWQLKEGVFIPLEIRHDNSPVATELLAMTRSNTTFLNKVDSFRINEYALPTDTNPIGIQQIIKGNAFTENVLEGSPLLDDEGKVSAILVDSKLGIALPATTLRESLDRVINKNHETNPVVTTGMTPTYSFKKQVDSEERAFTVTVSAVAPNSPAAVSGVKAGDVIMSVGEEEVNWYSSFIKSISKPLPLKVTVLRNGESQTLTINKETE